MNICGCSQRHGKLYTLCKSTWFTYNCCIFPIFCERLLWVGKKGDSKSTWPFSLVATNLEKLHLFCIPLHILSPLLWIFGGYMDSMKHSIRKHGKVFFPYILELFSAQFNSTSATTSLMYIFANLGHFIYDARARVNLVGKLWWFPMTKQCEVFSFSL